eukprot:4192106-Prymnesium_polylepis.1
MSKKQLAGVKQLRFKGLAVPSVDDVQSLGRCLNLCTSLQVLTATSLGISDAACAALFSTLARGALPQLKIFALADNQIGDEGMNSFSTALASGAMANLEELALFNNLIGDEGM